MAKKPSAKTTKKPARAGKATARSTRKTATESGRVQKASGAKGMKYEQAGAPWWKQFLPQA